MAFFCLPFFGVIAPSELDIPRSTTVRSFILAICLGFRGRPTVSAQPPSAVDLGTLEGVNTAQASLSSAQIAWYRFQYELAEGTAAYLDITTNFDDGGLEIPDTEIAIYSSDGQLITSDGDDEGFGLQSTLSFGVGSGPDAGRSVQPGWRPNANGEHGDLDPGIYYVAVSGFDATFDDDWQAVSDSDLAGTYRLTLYTPLPCRSRCREYCC